VSHKLPADRCCAAAAKIILGKIERFAEWLWLDSDSLSSTRLHGVACRKTLVAVRLLPPDGLLACFQCREVREDHIDWLIRLGARG